MYCRNCGKEIDINAYVCPNCGVKVERPEDNVSKAAVDDNGSKVGWGFLSYFIPLAGLILFLTWRNERPKTAKVCGICALVSVIVEVVFFVIFYVIIILSLGIIVF